MTPTRTRALDAAVELLATAGTRALTHARVDDRAGLPRGSTSNHFRTRAALLAGDTTLIVERETAELGGDFTPTTPAELVDGLCRLFEHLTVRNRALTTARLAIFVEASHDPELRATVNAGRAAVESWFLPALAVLGARRPRAAATAITGCVEGLVLHRIARHDDTDPRPALELVVAAAFT